MEPRAEDSFCLSANVLERLSLPATDRERPDGKSEGRDIFYGSELTRKQAYSGEVEGGEPRTAPAPGNGLHPSTAGGMDRSAPSEQQEEDLGPAEEADAKEEEEEEDKSEVEEAAEAKEMEDEGTEDDGEDKQSKRDSLLCQGAPSEEEEELQLHWDVSAQEKLHAYHEIQEGSETCLNEEALPSQEAEPGQQEQYAEGREEEEDCEAEFSRRDPSLDDMAKLITVEEVSPAAGLVSILKKRSVHVDRLTGPAGPEPRPERPTAKRRVRFKVPDDSYDHEVGGVDSCLLLFLLCLVTVVISIGGTTLYCALGDAQSSVCQDFSRNAEFYVDQIRRGIAQLQHWYTSGL